MLRGVILIVWWLPLCAFSQLDREFWFAVPEVVTEHADRPIKLHLSASNRNAEIIISIPANPSIPPLELVLAANTSTSVDLTVWIAELENNLYNIPVNKGLFISSTEQISAFYEVLGSRQNAVLNTDIFLLKGSNALGMEFFTPFQHIHDNHFSAGIAEAWSTIDVVATEDNTTVSFELTQDAFGQPSRTFSVVLNRGQTYSVRAASKAANLRLTGSVVTSDKPIAVTVKDDSVQRQNEGSHDLVGDQLIPIEYAGVQYILAAGENFIIGTEDNTSVDIGGGQVITIARSETYFFENQAPVYIESTQPIYVWQLKETLGEYGGALIPHSSCTGSYKVSFNRATAENLTLLFIVKTVGVNTFIMNGSSTLISAADFAVVPGTSGEWSFSEKVYNIGEVPVSTISNVENSTQPFHLGIINGSGSTGNRYGYFSNYNVLDLGVDFDACDNTMLEVAQGLDSYLWSTGETTAGIQVDSSGIFWVKGVEGTCVAIDTIEVIVKPGITFALPKDTFFCNQQGIIIQADEGNYTYEWSNGDTTSAILVVSEGTYRIKVTNEFGCSARDVINIESKGFTPLHFDNILLCKADSTLRIEDEDVDVVWVYDDDTISTSKSITIQNPGRYVVSVSGFCGAEQDTFSVETRHLETPNVFTPNQDGVNDHFTIPLGKGEWDFAVYNRWGREVFTADNFDGTWLVNDLNDGVYFYQLTDHTCEQKHKGWIQVLK